VTTCSVCGRRLLAQEPVALEYPNLNLVQTVPDADPQVAVVLILAAAGYLSESSLDAVHSLSGPLNLSDKLSEVSGEREVLQQAWEEVVKCTHPWDVDGEFGTTCPACRIPIPEGEQVYAATGHYSAEVFTPESPT